MIKPDLVLCTQITGDKSYLSFQKRTLFILDPQAEMGDLQCDKLNAEDEACC